MFGGRGKSGRSADEVDRGQVGEIFSGTQKAASVAGCGTRLALIDPAETRVRPGLRGGPLPFYLLAGGTQLRT